MSTLCSTCQNKKPQVFLGTCRKCSAVTTSFDFQLCDTCAQNLQECKWCRAPLGATSPSGPVHQTASPYFYVKQDSDNGATIKGATINEQVHVQLSEDQYSGKQWGIKTTGFGIGRPSAGGTFAPDQGNPQFGRRIFVFDLKHTGTYDIVMHEVSRGWGWGGGGGGTPVANGKTWKITVKIV